MNLKNIGDKLNSVWGEIHKTGVKQESQLDELIKVLKEKNLIAEAPVINTETTDIEPIITAVKEIPTTDLTELIKAVEGIDTKPSVTVENKEVTVEAPVVNVDTDLQPVIDAIKRIDVKPEVTVQSKEITVEKQTSDTPQEYMPARLTDGKKFIDLEKWLREIVKNTTAGYAGFGDTIKVTNPDGSPIGGAVNYSINDIDDTTSTEYYGFTTNDGVYQIRKVTVSGVSYATILNNSGTADYTTAWSNKASLTYGRYDEAF